jgi:hypothetical protein
LRAPNAHLARASVTTRPDALLSVGRDGAASHDEQGKALSRRPATILVATLISASVALPASAHGSCTDSNDYFCAFDGTSYSTQLTYFLPVSGKTYDVADNKTSSVTNHHPSHSVCGVEAEGWPDRTVLTVGPTQHISALGSESNNQIEHFYTC